MPDAPAYPADQPQPTPAPRQPGPERESFPEWLKEEIAQGSDPKMRLALRQALIRAIKASVGVQKQGSRNEDQNYSYLGHAQALDAVRAAMANEGLNIEQVLLEPTGTVMVNKGAYARFTWRAIYLVTHTDGGILPRIIRAWTGDNDKSPYVASTMADRVMLLRLMRMGGSKEDDDNNPQEAQQQQARPAQRQQRTPAPRAAPQISPEQMKAAQDMLTELLENLKLCKTSDAFVTWARIYQHDYGLPQNIQKQGWTEWGKAVQALNYAPAELAEQARRAGKVNDGPADGEVTSDSEPPLAPAGTPASSPPKEPSEQAR